MKGLRLTFRLRLALVYIAALITVGAALLLVNYRIVAAQLDSSVIGFTAVDLSSAPGPGRGDFTPNIVHIGGRQLSATNQVPIPRPGLQPDTISQLSSSGQVTSIATGWAVTEVRNVTLRNLITYSAIAMALVVVLAVLSGWLIAGRLLRPVAVLTDTVARLTHGTLDQRIAVTGAPDEIHRLSTTFNEMLQRLQDAFAHEHRLMADVSHELRTPLANQRVVLEVGLDDPDASAADLRDMGRTSLAQNVRAQQLIDSMLLLAKAEQAPPDARSTLDLAEMTAAAATRLTGENSLENVTALSISLDLRPASTQGETILIEHLIKNLLTNSVLHNQLDGWVHIGTDTIEKTPGSTAAVLTIGNSGPQIDPDLVNDLFEPFRKAVGVRTHSNRGHGLGLAIAKAIALRHGASITATPQPAGGLRIVVEFVSSATASIG